MKKHKAIVQGAVYRKEWSVSEEFVSRGYYGLEASTKEEELISLEYEMDIMRYSKPLEELVFVNYKNIWEGEMESPVLQVGEVIFVDDNQEELLIDSVLRSTSSSYIYRSRDKVEVIEDEKSKETKIATDQRMEENRLGLEEIEEKVISLRTEIEQDKEAIEQARFNEVCDSNGRLDAYKLSKRNKKENRGWLW